MNKRNKGFSLAEVVVAVGIFAFSIVGIVGFMGAMGKQASDVVETDDAARFVEVIQSELQRMVDRSGSYSGVTSLFGRDIFATRGSAILSTQETLGNGERFFQITLERNEMLSPGGEDGNSGFLAMMMKLKWPAYLPNGKEVPDQDRNVMLIPVSVHR